MNKFNALRSVLIVAIVLVQISGPTDAIKIIAGTGDGSGTASVTGEYKLQNSAFLDMDITLGQGTVSRLSSAGGMGENTLSESVSGSSGSITNTISSDGSFRSNNRDFASGEVAVSSYQTSLDGYSGSIGTVSTGMENKISVAGEFLGDGGNLDANLVSVAEKRSWIDGEGKIAGIECLNNKVLAEIKSIDADSLGMSINGLYLAEGDIGDFRFTAQNIKKKDAGSISSVDNAGNAVLKVDGTVSQAKDKGKHPELTVAGGAPENYVYPREVYGAPYEGNPYWEIGSPVKYYLRTDSRFSAEGLHSNIVEKLLTDAMQTWDYWTPRQLFHSVESTLIYSPDPEYDGRNVIGWESGGGNGWLAYNSVWWWNPGADGKNILADSDLVFNSDFGWTKDWNKANSQEWNGNPQEYELDLQAVALHELGHTVGLGDLYLLDGTGDPRFGGPEIMNYYYLSRDTHHNLGLGDITGLQSIYGS
jgi:hypothetical protein